MSQVIENFCNYYEEMTKASLKQLDLLYSNNAEFVDPVHSIKGLDNITEYFEKMVSNINYCRFDIDEIIETDKQAFVSWVMHFSHPKLNSGRNIAVPGSSHLKFKETIYFHRDYYDLGNMIYEHIPLVKSLIGNIKKRISA